MATHEVYLESAMNPHHCGYGGVMTHPVRPLPLRLFTALIVCLTLALGGCSSTSEPPKGWHTFEEGTLSVAVRDDWMVPELNGNPTGMFDVIMQDTDHFESTETQVRFAAITDYASVYPGVTDTHGAESALEYVLVADPYGQAHPVLPDPIDLSRDGQKIFRQDVPRGSEGNVYYLWAAESIDGDVAVVALGGEGLTEEMISTIDSTISARHVSKNG